MSNPRESIRDAIRRLKEQIVALGVGETARLVGDIVRATLTEVTRGAPRRRGRPSKATARATNPAAT